MDPYTKIAPGIFTFHVVDTEGNFNIHNQIPMQTMRLKMVRAQFDNNSTVPKYLSVKFPWLSTFQLIDKELDRFELIIPVGANPAPSASNPEVSLYYTDLPIYMSKHIHESFEYRILDDTGNTPNDFVSLTLVFEFTYGRTS